jgi:hypothetical protein
MDVEALFCFLNEIEASKAAFFLEPTEMLLKPGESKVKKNKKYFLVMKNFYFFIDT